VQSLLPTRVLEHGGYSLLGQLHRRYTREGMESHLQMHGSIFRANHGHSITYAHENPFSSWSIFVRFEHRVPAALS
jgi:hypothetical protein